MSAFPPLASFMPHRPPMLLVDELIEWSQERVICTRTLQAGDVFVEQGRVSALLAIELFAQAAAAHFAYGGLQRGSAMTQGALLGARRIDFALSELEVGQTLRISATQVMSMPPAAQYECTLHRAEELIAEGTITVALGLPGEREGT